MNKKKEEIQILAREAYALHLKSIECIKALGCPSPPTIVIDPISFEFALTTYSLAQMVELIERILAEQARLTSTFWR